MVIYTYRARPGNSALTTGQIQSMTYEQAGSGLSFSYTYDSAGATVVSYEYDPFGNIITAIGAMAEATPLGYRDYYYDRETSFYYLNSRYYDP